MKKRNQDIIRHKDIHSISLFSILFFFIIIFAIGSNTRLLDANLVKINNFYRLKSENNIFNKDYNLNIVSPEKENKNINASYYRALDIVAKSYVVYDVKNKNIISSRNEDEVLPLASLTKVVSAITAINLADKDTKITINKNLMRKDESLDVGMSSGQVWRLSDLLKYALTISSNSSMDIIASTLANSNSLFVDEMNNYVKELGFQNFYFNSASGLDYGDVIGGKGTALEYAKLFAKSYELIPDILSYTINSRVNLSGLQKVYQVPNTNKDASKTVGLLASKTGFTDAAGGNLAIMFNNEVDRPIVIIVLGSTAENRFTDVDKLYMATISALQ